MSVPRRTHRIEATDPGGEPVCVLTAAGARQRDVPIDRLLAQGDFAVTASGYEVRLPAGEAQWTLANRFIEEEASCCASLTLEAEERDGAVIVRAAR